tara:strand:+ start:645 stop:2270 length:1626 start_codon:yes stop_codon:yes gene_type:complete
MALIVKGGSSFSLETMKIKELYDLGSEGTDRITPQISTLSGVFQRLSQVYEWTKNDHAKAKEYIVSLFYGTGLIETFILVPLNLLIEKVEHRASDKRYFDKEKTKVNSYYIEDKTIRNVWKEACNLIQSDIEKGVVFYLMDGQNRLNNAIIPFKNNKWQLQTKDGSELIIYDDETEVHHNINRMNFSLKPEDESVECLPKPIQDYFDNIEVPVAIATKGEIEKLAEILIWKNEGLPWVEWQILYTQKWYTKFRAQIESLVGKKNVDFLSKLDLKVYQKDLNGIEKIIAECLCYLNRGFFPNSNDNTILNDFFDGKHEVLDSEIDFLKKEFSNLAEVYKDVKKININVIRNYLMLMWSFKKGHKKLSMPNWKIEKGVHFASEYKILNSLLLTKKSEKKGKYWSLNWQEVETVVDNKKKTIIEHKTGGYVWANKILGEEHNLSRLLHLRNCLMEREKDLISNNVIIKLATDEMSSIEEYYVENDRKDIEGNSIEAFNLSKYHRGHKIPKADGGANGLGTGNVKPQLASDNLSYGRSEIPNESL